MQTRKLLLKAADIEKNVYVLSGKGTVIIEGDSY
jgi:quercetin dioxygenase-like cupin family protein